MARVGHPILLACSRWTRCTLPDMGGAIDHSHPLVSDHPAGERSVRLILASASRRFFFAALRELRLDSAAVISGRGSQCPAGAGGLKI